MRILSITTFTGPGFQKVALIDRKSAWWPFSRRRVIEEYRQTSSFDWRRYPDGLKNVDVSLALHAHEDFQRFQRAVDMNAGATNEP